MPQKGLSLTASGWLAWKRTFLPHIRAVERRPLRNRRRTTSLLRGSDASPKATCTFARPDTNEVGESQALQTKPLPLRTHWSIGKIHRGAREGTREGWGKTTNTSGTSLKTDNRGLLAVHAPLQQRHGQKILLTLENHLATF